jgi:hypothetical protein
MSNITSEKAPFETEANKSDPEINSGVDVLVEEHAHLSVGDILRGTAVHESTPFERKAALINA